MYEQSEEDVADGKASSPIPPASEGKDAVVEAAVANVFAQMNGDRKTTALKSLQARPLASHVGMSVS